MEIKIDAAVIAMLSVLVSTVGALALYIKSLHRHHTVAQKENLVSMTEAMVKNSVATQNNSDIMKEVKTLLHSMNDRQLQNGNN